MSGAAGIAEELLLFQCCIRTHALLPLYQERHGGCTYAVLGTHAVLGDDLNDVWLGIPAEACIRVQQDLITCIIGCKRLLAIPLGPADKSMLSCKDWQA